VIQLTEPLFQRLIPVGDNRVIGVNAYGSSEGRTMVWMHGTPGGGRQVPEALRRALPDYDVRLVVVERPGYGASSYHSYEQIRDFTADVDQVLDRLDIDRFCVGGLSGGGPYALAIAHDYPSRVASAVVLGGVGPHAGPEAVAGGAVGMFSPLGGIAEPASRAVGRTLQGLVALLTPIAEPAFGLVTKLFPPGDRLVLDDPEISAMFIDDTIRQATGGLAGPPLDLKLFVRDWGFEIGDLTVPVHLWQGDADPIVPLDHAEHMATLIPGATLAIRPRESHLGGFAAANEAVLTAMSHWS
jgi:pimeloyl-ACP methyl ester carboxylesterase